MSISEQINNIVEHYAPLFLVMDDIRQIRLTLQYVIRDSRNIGLTKEVVDLINEGGGDIVLLSQAAEMHLERIREEREELEEVRKEKKKLERKSAEETLDELLTKYDLDLSQYITDEDVEQYAEYHELVIGRRL